MMTKSKQMEKLNVARKETEEDLTVNITGFSVVSDRRTSFLRRSYWTAVLLCGLIYLMAQTSDRMFFFFSWPVSVNVEILHNKSLYFPEVTFCTSTPNMYQEFNPLLIRQWHSETFPDEEYPGFVSTVKRMMEKKNVKEMWTNMSWNLSSMIESCYLGRGNPCSNAGTFHETLTFLGPCLTFAGHFVNMAGSYHGLYLSLSFPNVSRGDYSEYFPIPSGWAVSVHGDWEDPSLRVKTNQYYVGFNWNKAISLFYKEFKSVDVEEKRCVQKGEEISVCYTKCFEEAFVQEINCSFPYMNSTAAPCIGVDYEKGYKLMNNMLIYGKWIPNDCSCSQPCLSRNYEYHGDTTEDRVDGISRLKVYYEDMNYEMITEYFSYGFPTLISDFGGMMGLLLGASVLTLLEIIEFGGQKIANYYVKEKADKKRKKAKQMRKFRKLNEAKVIPEKLEKSCAWTIG